MSVENENVVSREWVDANQKVIASWSVFHLIWMLMHDLALSSPGYFYLFMRERDINKGKQENMLLELESKCKDIVNAIEYLHEIYGKYEIAGLTHGKAPEQGEAFIAALDGINKVRDCLRINTAEIARIEKDFSQDNFGSLNKDQRHSLKVEFMLNRKLITILSVIEIWASARDIS